MQPESGASHRPSGQSCSSAANVARAIVSGRLDGNLDEQVAARLARRAILDRTGAPQLWCILVEGVLHRAIGGSKVGLRQPAEDNRLLACRGPR
jgi:Domain of unknown function (DUF5753)